MIATDTIDAPNTRAATEQSDLLMMRRAREGYRFVRLETMRAPGGVRFVIHYRKEDEDA